MVRWLSNFLGGTRMRRYFLPVSIVASALFVASGAWADTPQGAAPAGSGAPAPADTTKTTTAVPLGKGKALYSAKVLKGHAAYIARDFQGAIAAYKDAIKDDANDAFAQYFLGEAQLAAGN